MPRTIEWLLWQVLHLLFALYCHVAAGVSWVRSWICSIDVESSRVKEVAAGGKPLTVALVFEPQEAVDKDGKIPLLIQWLSMTNVSQVTLYDAQGTLKRSQGELQKVLNSLETEEQTIRCYSQAEVLPEMSNGSHCLWEVQSINKSANVVKESDKLAQSGNSDSVRRRKISGGGLGSEEPQSEMDRKSYMKVELLSLQDGKGSLVRAARHVCENAYKLHYAEQSTKGAKLTEDDINKSLQATGGEGPDPDLLLLFGTTRSLLGFPPWRLRLTEIMHMGSMKNLTEHSFVSALREFSMKTHRYGR